MLFRRLWFRPSGWLLLLRSFLRCVYSFLARWSCLVSCSCCCSCVLGSFGWLVSASGSSSVLVCRCDVLLDGFGRGGGGAFGWHSLRMCQSHNFLSSAMCSQLLSLPSGFCCCVVMQFPVVLHLTVIVSVVSSGRSALRLRTIAFLLVDSTPDFGRGFLIHAVIRSFGGCASGALVVFPRKFIDLALRIDSASGIS